MPLRQSYVVWNNKGGVGKTTLTFHMASHYAIKNPNRKVLVIDMCPQANVSMALLSTAQTRGSTHVAEIHREGKTVSFYLEQVTQPGSGQQQSMPAPTEYLAHVSEKNPRMPENLYLLCGDMYLELLGRELERRRSGDDTPFFLPWVCITNCFRQFIEGQNGVATVDQDAEWVVFIDTNPSFSVYTEIALLAAQRLIIPINADDYSVEAVEKMLELVYGRVPADESEAFKAYRSKLFSAKVTHYGPTKVRRPVIHLVVNNRVTAYRTRAAAAFGAVGNRIFEFLYHAFGEDHGRNSFAPLGFPDPGSQRVPPQGSQGVSSQDPWKVPPQGAQGESLQDPQGVPPQGPSTAMPRKEVFEKRYVVDIQDFHSTAVVAAHNGCPLSRLAENQKVFGEKVRVNASGVENYVVNLNALVNKL